MKSLILILVAIPQLLWAGLTCPEGKPEAKMFQSQEDWMPQTFTEKNPSFGGSLKADGYVDSKNNFYVGNISQVIKQKPVVKAVSSPEKVEKFEKLCSRAESYGRSLTSLRRRKKGVDLIFRIGVLPSLEGYSNDPYTDQNFQRRKRDVSVEYGGSSIVANIRRSQSHQEDILQNLKTQILQQDSMTSYEIRLNSMDDFACDLMRGDATLVIVDYLKADDPKLQQNENYPAEEIFGLHEEWKKIFESQKHISTVEAAFEAGAVFADLKGSGWIPGLDGTVGLSLFSKFYDQKKERFVPQTEQQLQCLADDFQEYERLQSGYTIRHEVQLDQRMMITEESQ